MKKFLIVIIAVIAIAGLSFLSWQFFGNPSEPTPVSSSTTPFTPIGTDVGPITPSIPVTTTPYFSGLNILTPAGDNPTVSSPLKITGYVNGAGWTGFEGQVGTVKLYDATGNVLASAILTATTEWTKLPTFFEATLEFETSAATGELLFQNENPSGISANDLIKRVFVKFAPVTTSSAQMQVKAFFANNTMDPAITCNQVFPVTRIVPKTKAVAAAALNELLKGPTKYEGLTLGYSTAINDGVVVQSLTISPTGTAYVDFNERLQEGVGGSCRVAMIRAQIEQTLKQFSTIKNVVISINGNSEDILQP